MSSVEQTQLIADLNDDLRLEFQSNVQYVATITGAEFTSTVDELEVHLGQELAHATALAEQVAFRGGAPETSVGDVPVVADSRAALQSDVQLEEQQLERDRRRVEHATNAACPTSPRPFARCSPRPRSHVRDLQAALGI